MGQVTGNHRCASFPDGSAGLCSPKPRRRGSTRVLRRPTETATQTSPSRRKPARSALEDLPDQRKHPSQRRFQCYPSQLQRHTGTRSIRGPRSPLITWVRTNSDGWSITRKRAVILPCMFSGARHLETEGRQGGGERRSREAQTKDLNRDECSIMRLILRLGICRGHFVQRCC